MSKFRHRFGGMRTKDLESVMGYLLDHQVASYEPLTREQRVFLELAAMLNDELRLRNPRRNAKLYKRLMDAALPHKGDAPADGKREP